MNYELKLLDSTLRHSQDSQVLNNACIYYKNLLYYLNVMKETKDLQLFFRLQNICYKEPEEEDGKVINKAIELANSTYSLDNKKNQNITDKRTSLLSAIENAYFTEEKLNNDIKLVTSLITQYQLLLLDVIKNNEQNKRLNK